MAIVDSRYGSGSAPAEPSVPPKPAAPRQESVGKQHSFSAGPAPVPQARRSGKQPAPRRRSPILPIVGICAAVVLLVFLVVQFGLPLIQAMSDPFGGRIQGEVSVAGVDIGGMTKQQAVKAVKNAVGSSYGKEAMVVTLPDTTLQLSPKDTGAALDVAALVDMAYSFGRTDAVPAEKQELELLPYLKLNEEYIHSALSDYAAQFPDLYTPAEFALDGAVPALEEGKFDENASCPTLVLHTGTSGFGLDMEGIYQQVLAAYGSADFEVNAADMQIENAPEALKAKEVYEQIAIAPVNAQIDPATHKAIPGSYGLSFDTSELQKQLNKAGQGETIEIPMTYVTPDVVGQEVYFQDILGFCETPHGNNEKRNNNLKLACSTLNGIVLQPGEVLSYNATLGERTKENGYQPAPAYSGTNLVDSIGGGICQVSSTLYLCSLYAEMEILDRVNHGYPVAYIPYGLDATVSWGAPDLKISNSSAYPVKIVAEECDGFVRIWLMGTEVRDYYIKMGFSSGGRYAKSTVCKYDRKTDELISKEDGAYSAYLSEINSIRGEIAMNQAYVNGMARDQEPCSPTPETLEASKNYSSANQNG